MATTSFDKSFVVTDAMSIKQLKADIESPQTVSVRSYNRKAEDKKGIKLFKQRFLGLANS